MKAGCDYYYVKGDVKRRFTYLGKKSAYPLSPVNLIRWEDSKEENVACFSMWKSFGATIKEVIQA